MELLEKELAEEKIDIPENPFMDVLKRFGRDETTAGAFNVGSTALADIVLKACSETTRNIGLSVTGPVVEKVGLLYWYFKEAADIYKTTPKEERKSITHYFWNAFKAGSPTLVEDLTVHDPMYTMMMYAGMQAYPSTPAWMISLASFVASVFAVSGLEVGYKELGFWNKKRKLKNAGFGFEKYFESRITLGANEDTNKVLEEVGELFDLGPKETWDYHDLYFENELPEFSGREPKVRLRRRVRADGQEVMQTAQIVYTRAVEIAKGELSQYRYFPSSKDKMYFKLDQKMPSRIEDIEDDDVRKVLQNATNNEEPHNVEFRRTYVNNPETLLVSADTVNCVRPFNVVEIKAYDKVDMLKEAIRYVMSRFDVVGQTTQGKLSLVNGS